MEVQVDAEQNARTEDVWNDLKKIRSLLRSVKGNQVESKTVREQAKSAVQNYFRTHRPALISCEIDVTQLDLEEQKLLALANARSSKSSYQKVLKSAIKLQTEIELAQELHIGNKATKTNGQKASHDSLDQRIVKTLEALLPNSALGYKQAILDLQDDTRLSYRGVASELREVLREVVDHLAPDKEVMAQKDFKLVDDCDGPTMSQKVNFILKNRSASKNAMETALNSVSSINEGITKLARSVYNRGSASTHGKTTQREVSQIRRYIDTLLFELLEIAD